MFVVWCSYNGLVNHMLVPSFCKKIWCESFSFNSLALHDRRVIPLETSLKDPSFIAWSKTSSHLAVVTAKGNLLIYNKTKKQKIPVVGKHSKRITCGSWSRGGNKLALGADDRSLTISNENGETLIHTELKHAPLQTWYRSCFAVLPYFL